MDPKIAMIYYENVIYWIDGILRKKIIPEVYNKQINYMVFNISEGGILQEQYYRS